VAQIILQVNFILTLNQHHKQWIYGIQLQWEHIIYKWRSNKRSCN